MAGISGSKHDFTGKTFEPVGRCSACHLAHKAQPGRVLWTRSLSQEATYFSQVSAPNYVRDTTLLCYDCHDNHAAVDNDPLAADFTTGRAPQDVAFDNDMNGGTPVPYTSNPTDNLGGYYETDPPNTVPPTGAGALTLAHFIKNDPGSGITIGDKLPCSDCHNPHETRNQAFIKVPLAGKTVTGYVASTFMAYDDATRNDDLSREICINCHGTSDNTTTTVTFRDVNPRYTSTNKICILPATVPQHNSVSQVACTACHPHNPNRANCKDCHAYPMLTAGHQRHKDALGTQFSCEICHGPSAGFNDATYSYHNGTNMVAGQNWATTYQKAQVDIMGQSLYWDAEGTRPATFPASGYTGTNSGAYSPVPPGFEFTAKGADDGANRGRCFNLSCHGNPPNTSGALNWNDDMLNDTTGDAVAIDVCRWCHGAGTNNKPAIWRINSSSYVYGPNVMGDMTLFGAEINGHGKTVGTYDKIDVGDGLGLNVAAKNCTVCHDGVYVAGVPRETHFDNSYDSANVRLRATINSVATINDDPDNACVACHQNVPTPDGSQIAHHGNNNPQYTPLEGTARTLRACRQCHEVHGLNWNNNPTAGQPKRNLYMIGKWLDNSAAPATYGTPDAGEQARVDSTTLLAPNNLKANITTSDNAVILTHRTGTDSFDEVDTVGTQDTDDICATCHNTTTTRGGDHSGTSGYTTDERGSDCTGCHQHNFDLVTALTWADGFLPAGGSDIMQCYDDATSATNYNDVSHHPLVTGSLTFPSAPNCVSCHKSSGTFTSNECIKCHYEGYYNGTSWVFVYHRDGQLDLRTTASGAIAPPNPYMVAPNRSLPNLLYIPKRSTNAVASHCVVCHGSDVGTNQGYYLNGIKPVDILIAATWGAAYGHGSTSSLSLDPGRTVTAGPPNYDCRDCHGTLSYTTGGTTLTQIPGGFHCSRNDWLIKNVTYATPEYNTPNTKNVYCSTSCHQNTAAPTKDDNVIDHTWSKATLETSNQAGCPQNLTLDPKVLINKCENHPSNYDIQAVAGFYKEPAALPLSSFIYNGTGNRAALTLPGALTGSMVCTTCHEVHGNSTVGNSSPTKDMIRLDSSPTSSALCQECHL